MQVSVTATAAVGGSYIEAVMVREYYIHHPESGEHDREHARARITIEPSKAGFYVLIFPADMIEGAKTVLSDVSISDIVKECERNRYVMGRGEEA